MTWQFKDPDETLDYQIDWSTTLGTDTISTSVWTVPVGITEASSANTTTTATIFLSGGTDGTRYDLTNTITTAGGLTHEYVASVFVRSSEVIPVLDATVKGASADSYVTEVEYLDYALKRGWSVSTGAEASLRTARLYLDNAYSWRGLKQTDAQALPWPRTINEYVDGYAVPTDAIPQAIKDAQCEMAYLVASGETPFAVLSGGAILSKREKVDVIEEATTYSEATVRDRDAYPIVDQLVAPYAWGKAGQVGSMMLKRA